MARRRGGRWPRYVPVAERKAAAAREMQSLAKTGKDINPVTVSGRAIASTFWGKSWCVHLEKFSDYSNRLPRGRTYVRNGSVVDLAIETGRIEALVNGSSMYRIDISISPLPKKKWTALKAQCAGGISSALELLQGKISDNVMQSVCDRDSGLFPSPAEIKLSCDCPDWADLCKHLAAVLYGVGARLDESPELLFKLRGVDYQELISAELAIDVGPAESELTGDLGDIFGIDLDDSVEIDLAPQAAGNKSKRKARRKVGSSALSTVKAKPARKKKQPEKSQAAGSEINISRGIRASHIKKLRKVCELSESDFAVLTGKSVTAVRSWESRAGVLNLQRASQQALQSVFSMTPAEMKKKLSKAGR